MTRQRLLIVAFVLAAIGLIPVAVGLAVGPPLLEQNEGAIANAATLHSRLSVGTTEDETQIKATAGAVFSITATNINAAARYLKCYDLTAAVAVPGTSTPWIRLAIPSTVAGGPLQVAFPNGVFFGTALTCALVTGAADSDVAEVAAAEVMWAIAYK